jgi:hypothetical protein
MSRDAKAVTIHIGETRPKEGRPFAAVKALFSVVSSWGLKSVRGTAWTRSYQSIQEKPSIDS